MWLPRGMLLCLVLNAIGRRGAFKLMVKATSGLSRHLWRVNDFWVTLGGPPGKFVPFYGKYTTQVFSITYTWWHLAKFEPWIHTATKWSVCYPGSEKTYIEKAISWTLTIAVALSLEKRSIFLKVKLCSLQTLTRRTLTSPGTSSNSGVGRRRNGRGGPTPATGTGRTTRPTPPLPPSPTSSPRRGRTQNITSRYYYFLKTGRFGQKNLNAPLLLWKIPVVHKHICQVSVHPYFAWRHLSIF